MAIAALRFVGSAQSLWIDEIYSAELIRWPLDTILRVQDGHPPLFALLHLRGRARRRRGSRWSPDLGHRGVLAVGLLVWLASELWTRGRASSPVILLAPRPIHVGTRGRDAATRSSS